MSKFKILWIDDQKEKCKKDIRAVKRIIESFDYEPEIVLIDDISGESLCSDGGTLKIAITSRDIDLFVIDFNLRDNIFGTDVVEEIRNNNDIYTDIVFYSSMPSTLIDAVKKSYDGTSIMNYYDGVYIAPLGDEFTEKMHSIINKVIKSWYNVHSIRGILLSKASKFEQMVSTIILQNYSSCLSTIKDDLSCKGKNVCESTSRKWKAVESHSDPIQLILKDPINFNWTVKRIIFERLINERAISISTLEDIKTIFSLRNDFAHNPMHIKQGKLILSTIKGDVEYTEESIDSIRASLVRIEKDLQNVINNTGSSEIIPNLSENE